MPKKRPGHLSKFGYKRLWRLIAGILRYRHLEYPLFVFFLFWKLRYLHHNLNAINIDMNRLDNLIAIGSLILASFWTLFLSARARSAALALLNVLLTAVIFADLVYYRYFRDFITVPVLLQAGQVGELGESISSLILPSDLWLAADWFITVAILCGLLLRRRGISAHIRQRNVTADASSAKSGKRPMGRLLAGMLAFMLGYALTMGPIQHYKDTWAGELFTGNWWNLSLYNITGLLGFHYYDAYRYAKEHLSSRPALSAEEHKEIKQWFHGAAEKRKPHNEAFAAYQDNNIIVVQVEALMNFVIGKDINGEEVTPHLNRLMKDSLYFAGHYHQTGQGRTSDADFSSNSSLHPLPTGSAFVRFPNHDYDMLPQILGEHGYVTGAYHAYEGSFWNRNAMYKAMGYDHFYNKKHFEMDEPLGWSLGDKSFFRQSLSFMTQVNRKPFYAFLVTLTSHHPYQLPAAERKLDVGEFQGTIFGSYLESVHYADEALGQLIDGMKQKGIWENTILYIYGDHDNSLKDKEPYEQFLGKSLSELDMHQIMNQVPLLIHLPDDGQTGVYQEPAGQLDMAPSLLHLLGIKSDSYYLMGNNLFGNGDRFVVLRSGAFTDGRVYYIPSADGLFEHGQCYNLDTRELTGVEPCRRGHEEAQLRLSISDRVIQYNLLREYR